MDFISGFHLLIQGAVLIYRNFMPVHGKTYIATSLTVVFNHESKASAGSQLKKVENY